MRTLHRVSLALGAMMAVMGIGQLVAGTRFIPGAEHADPVVDSQIRALGALAVWAGATQVWATQHQSAPLLRLLGAVTASLVGARAVNIAEHGRPTGVLPVAILREAVSAAVLLIYSTALARQHRHRR